MRFDVLTLFPEMFPAYLGQSLLKLAIERQLVDIQLHNMRDWAHDKHHQVDDRPFGGGPGMLLKPGPVVECVEHVQQLTQQPGHLVLLSPVGRRLEQPVVGAMVVIDAVLRLVPGVLGDEQSNKHDSFSGRQRRLEFAQYTRPRVYRELEVPAVLTSGNHEEIARWREQNSLERTRQRRADLL